ncbi:hypothetical protein N0V94_003740 [Neodidymelliopsis sp. IMI 364377]|nr:hypothetical protein N0V94_003740 [Neodidymelliopsis sp. IMI 364377]
MTEKGTTTTTDQVKAKHEELVEHPENNKEQTHVLYHPADRDTAIFKGESGASLVARLYVPERAFGLIIPETLKGRESYYKDVEWFTMKPRPNSSFETIWRNMWKPYGPEEIVALTKSFKFPFTGCKFFSWALVVVHRRIAVGEEISDTDIGSWIQQYGSYLAACGIPYEPEGRKFTFDAKKPYSGRQITYHELTGWILNPRFGNGLHFQFAQRFDDALDALINYNLDCTDAKWSAFREKMQAARKVPW